MELRVSHDRAAESPEAKARWFGSLPVEQRLAILDELTNMILQCNPNILRHKHAEPVPGRVCVLKLP
jgi:hypothetical protein